MRKQQTDSHTKTFTSSLILCNPTAEFEHKRKYSLMFIMHGQISINVNRTFSSSKYFCLTNLWKVVKSVFLTAHFIPHMGGTIEMSYNPVTFPFKVVSVVDTLRHSSMRSLVILFRSVLPRLSFLSSGVTRVTPG